MTTHNSANISDKLLPRFLVKFKYYLKGWRKCEIPDWIDQNKFHWIQDHSLVYVVKGRSFVYKIITPSMNCYRRRRHGH